MPEKTERHPPYEDSEIIDWLTNNPPDPDCWYKLCHDGEYSDDENCPELGWFGGRQYVWAEFDENAKLKDINWLVTNDRCWSLYIGEVGFLSIGLSISDNGETGKWFYSTNVKDTHEIECDIAYFSEVWELGMEYGYIEMLESQEQHRLAEEEKKEKARQLKEFKNQKKLAKERAAQAQYALF